MSAGADAAQLRSERKYVALFLSVIVALIASTVIVGIYLPEGRAKLRVEYFLLGGYVISCSGLALKGGMRGRLIAVVVAVGLLVYVGTAF